MQANNPEFAGGANAESLDEARSNFLRIGASSEENRKWVRPPKPEEVPKPLS